MKMLRFSLGTREDKQRNENSRGTVHGGKFGDKVNSEIEVVWARVEERLRIHREANVEMELLGTRERGRPKRRFMDAVKEDMQAAGVTEEDAEDKER